MNTTAIPLETPPGIRKHTRLALVATCLLLASIPFSVALVNVFAALLLVSVVTNPVFWSDAKHILRIREIQLAMGIWLLLLIGCFYSVAGFSVAIDNWEKYRKLLLIPLVYWTAYRSRGVQTAMYALLLSLTLMLIVSFTNHFGLTDLKSSATRSIAETATWLVAHHRITHGFLLATLALLALAFCIRSDAEKLKAVYFLIAAAASFNVNGLNDGKTGQVGLIAALIFLGAAWMLKAHRSIRNIAFAGLIGAISVSSLLWAPSNHLDRYTQIQSEIDQAPTEYAATGNGIRIESWKLSLKLMQDRPLLGHGTASLQSLSAVAIEEMQTPLLKPIAHPHNEYLMLGVQGGVLLLALFAYLLWRLMRASLEYNHAFGYFFSGFFVLYGTSCLVNPSLLDFNEGHLFCAMAGLVLAHRETLKTRH